MMRANDLQHLLSDERGSVVVIFGVGLPVLAALVGSAVEYASLSSRRAQLQGAVDAAAMSAVSQLRLANSSDSAVESAAQATVEASAPAKNGASHSIEATVLDSRSSVRVRVEETIPSVMGRLMNLPSATLAVQATAKLVGKSKLCLLTLEVAKDKALNLDSNSLITANGCTVYSNSAGKKGFRAGSGARATASRFCSVGGVDVGSATVTPAPIQDCPALADPLASVPRPVVGGCTATSLEISASQTLYPGTYCKGLKISGSAAVTLMPGAYVFDDGPLVVTGTASLLGQGAGLFFSGNAGGLRFDPDTSIDLTAPKTGPMAGILMFEDRSVSSPVAPPPGPKGAPPPPPYGSQPMRQYRISSNNAANLLGTIYLPAGRLIVDANTPVANRSAYTVIVSRQLEIDSGPNLYLNSDYSMTDVPVPVGVGPNSGAISLTQ
jgi:Flp pilus assembly protein TadG